MKSIIQNSFLKKLTLISFLICILSILQSSIILNSDTPTYADYKLGVKLNLKKQICKLQPRLDPYIAERIVNAVFKYSREYNLPEQLILAVIFRESSFKPMSRSNKDCLGLMQINYKVHKGSLPELENVTRYKCFHINNNIKAGCAILSFYITQSKTIEEALFKYYGSKDKQYVDDIFTLMKEM